MRGLVPLSLGWSIYWGEGDDDATHTCRYQPIQHSKVMRSFAQCQATAKLAGASSHVVISDPSAGGCFLWVMLYACMEGLTAWRWASCDVCGLLTSSSACMHPMHGR